MLKRRVRGQRRRKSNPNHDKWKRVGSRVVLVLGVVTALIKLYGAMSDAGLV